MGSGCSPGFTCLHENPGVLHARVHSGCGPDAAESSGVVCMKVGGGSSWGASIQLRRVLGFFIRSTSSMARDAGELGRSRDEASCDGLRRPSVSGFSSVGAGRWARCFLWAPREIARHDARVPGLGSRAGFLPPQTTKSHSPGAAALVRQRKTLSFQTQCDRVDSLPHRRACARTFANAAAGVRRTVRRWTNRTRFHAAAGAVVDALAPNVAALHAS